MAKPFATSLTLGAQLANIVFCGVVTLIFQRGILPVASAQPNRGPGAEQASPRPVAVSADPVAPRRASTSKRDASTTAPAKTENGGAPAAQQSRARSSSKGELAERDVPASEAKTGPLNKPLKTVQTPAGRKPPPIPLGAEAKVRRIAVPPVTPVERPWRTLNRGDVSLRERVQQALAQDESLTYSARGVSVDARDGEIILSGALSTQFEKARVAQIASRVDGARVVHDDMTVRTQRRSVR